MPYIISDTMYNIIGTLYLSVAHRLLPAVEMLCHTGKNLINLLR